MGALTITLNSPVSGTVPTLGTPPTLFKYQGDVRIVLETGVVIASPSSVYNTRIIYRKGDGTTGYWDATIINATQLYYDLTALDLDTVGEWALQAYYEDYSSPNNRYQFGQMAFLKVDTAVYYVSPLAP